MAEVLRVYEGKNESVLSLVPSSAARILDVGCGAGTIGEQLRLARERFVVGITYSPQEAQLASGRLSQVICAELSDFDFSPLGKFDCVILSHILEHLVSPEDLLDRLKCVLGPESVLVVALPNVVFWMQRLEFLFGRWRYRDWGILDRTHLRFFDRKSSRELLEQAGYEILAEKFEGPLPLVRFIRKLNAPLAKKITGSVCGLAPGLLSSQFVYLARAAR